jgi:hypothetical protein
MSYPTPVTFLKNKDIGRVPFRGMLVVRLTILWPLLNHFISDKRTVLLVFFYIFSSNCIVCQGTKSKEDHNFAAVVTLALQPPATSCKLLELLKPPPAIPLMAALDQNLNYPS